MIKGEKMNRKAVENKIRKALIILYVTAFLLEAFVLWLIIPSNNLDILTVSFSFPQVLAILLVMNIPLFVFTAIIVNAVKEIVLWHNSYKKGKNLLKLSSASAVLVIITVMLWFATVNTVSADLGDALYISTLLSALASVTVFVIYLFKNKKPG